MNFTDISLSITYGDRYGNAVFDSGDTAIFWLYRRDLHNTLRSPNVGSNQTSLSGVIGTHLTQKLANEFGRGLLEDDLEYVCKRLGATIGVSEDYGDIGKHNFSVLNPFPVTLRISRAFDSNTGETFNDHIVNYRSNGAMFCYTEDQGLIALELDFVSSR